MGEYKMKRTRNRNHVMIDQIKLLINKSFPPALGVRVEYFEGEDEDTDRVYIVFDMTSSTFGHLYRKSRRLGEGEAFVDVEADFVGAILADFVVLGTTLLTNTVIAKRVADKDDSDNILKHPFSKGRLKNVNLN